jgi:hypothetical protein
MTKDQEAVAELFKGIEGYSTRCEPYYRYVTVRYEELLKVPWPIRIIPFFTFEPKRVTEIRLSISREGFITFALTSMHELDVLKEYIAPILDKAGVFMLVKIPEEMILDEELPKIPGIAYLYP